MNPSAKAAQQIAEKCRNEVRLAIDVALQTRPEGPVDGWEKFLEHPMKQFDAIIQQALSDSLQPYRELAEKWRKEAIKCDELTMDVCADELEALLKQEGDK